MTNISMLIMPTPLPPKMQFSHIPTMGEIAGDRIEAVLLGVHGAAGHIGGDRGEDGARRGAEAHFLALEIAQVLVDGQARHRRQGHRALPPGAAALGIW